MADQVYVRKLTDKNLKRWKVDFPFLTKHPDMENQAYCNLCKQGLTPKRNVIQHHSTTKTHLVLSNSIGKKSAGRRVTSQENINLELISTVNTTTPAAITQIKLQQQPQLEPQAPPKVIEIQGPTTANVSLFGTEGGYVLESYETLEENDGDISHLLPAGTVLAEFLQEETEPGQTTVAKISANAQFPLFIQQEIQRRFFTMEGHDAFWKCNGGVFKMHKFVVSLFSPYIKSLLETNLEEEESVIYTPDLSSLTVKSLLCICYTGRVVLPRQELTEQIIKAFNEMGFHGEFTIEKQTIKQVKDEEIVAQVRGKRKRQEKRQRRVGKRGRPKRLKPVIDDKTAVTTESQLVLGDNNEILTQVIQKDNLVEGHQDYEIRTVLDDMEESEDEWKPTKNDEHDTSEDEGYDKDDLKMKTKLKAIDDSNVKVEMEEDIQDENILLDYNHLMVPQAYTDRDDEDKENRFEGSEEQQLESIDNSTKKKKDKIKERHRDAANRYFLIGSYNNFHKGQLSAQLREDLLDGNNDSLDNIESLFVCHLCYQVFPFADAYNLHMEEKHANKRPRHGRFYVGENTYHCPTCDHDITVLHIVWFVKHLKYCGVNDDMAAALLKPGDLDQPIPPKEEPKDPYADDCLSGRETDKRYTNLCDLLLGRFYPSIWGCRTCYEVFAEKQSLIQHYTSAHGGKLDYGSCYDKESGLYTCSYCNLVLKNRHLVLFIRHLKQCLVDPSLGVLRNQEEEGVDEDETEDTIDPWGVINRPLRVANLRSEWICEALFGRFIPILFPCHICYSVYQDEREIKQHFSEEHVNVENCVENGRLYNKDQDCYTCPLCRKDVCRNQKSSIYFTYHMKKCAGETRTVTRTCDKCNKTFNKYNTFTNHQLYFCSDNQNNGFICHICSTVIKTKRELDTHVKYVHSTVRQFECEQCQKRFKRKGDLVVHMQSHTAAPGFFCEKCGKSFFKKRNLKSHLSTHDTSDSSKKHECIECGRRFLRLQALKNHLTTHSSERLYSCEVCGARVKTQGTLMTHRKKVHKLNTALPLTAKLVPDTLIQQGHDDVSMATVTVAGAPTHTVVATMPGEGQQPAIIAHHKMATLIEASDIQHATTSDGTAVLLIKTEKMPNEDDNMPHLM